LTYDVPYDIIISEGRCKTGEKTKKALKEKDCLVPDSGQLNPLDHRRNQKSVSLSARVGRQKPSCPFSINHLRRKANEKIFNYRSSNFYYGRAVDSDSFKSRLA
jgi:hypothetical protein